MKRPSKFTIPANWNLVFNDLGIHPKAVLGYAELPPSLFDNAKIQLSPTEYFQLWDGLEKAAHAEGFELALKIAEVMRFECFDTPIFAAICSSNLNAALLRLQAYKPLIGPMILDLKQTDTETEVDIRCYGYSGTLPRSVNLTELVFFTQLARLATRSTIRPLQVELPALPKNADAYQAYFGCQITQGSKTRIVFSGDDARMPFLTSNQTMLGVFESELRDQLKEMGSSQTVSLNVYDQLMNLLPQGESSVEVVASNMSMSKRTLQRKLSAEGTNYQTVLNKVRAELAQYYLKETTLPVAEVSFLLGFQETNSFTRAYTSWMGCSPAQARS